jgi:hypothetical protein
MGEKVGTVSVTNFYLIGETNEKQNARDCKRI